MLMLMLFTASAFAASAQSWSLNMMDHDHLALAWPPWASNFTHGTQLQEQLNAAIERGDKEFDIPAGDFVFDSAAFVISGAKSMVVRGRGIGKTQFWFSSRSALEVVNCSDMEIGGFSTDLLFPPFSQGQLVSIDASTMSAVVQIDEGFPLPTPDTELFNQTCPDGKGICGEVKLIYWDPHTRLMQQGQQMNSPVSKAVCHQRLCTLSILNPIQWNPPAGSLITLSPRIGATKYPIPSYYKGHLLLYNSARVIVSDIDTHSSSTMTRLENLGFGSHVYRNVNIVRRSSPPYTPRLLATNSDGFHSFGVEHGPTMENCEMSFLADDFLNLHNRLLLLQEIDLSSATATVVDPGSVLGHDFVTTHTAPFLRRGDVLKLYSADSKHQYLGQLMLSSIAADGTASALPKPFASRVDPATASAWRCRFDAHGSAPPAQPLPPFGALVQVDRFASFGGVLRGNHFHDTYNNLGRFAASSFLFEGNLVERTQDGVHISSDLFLSFLEGSCGMGNFTIANNTFKGVRGCGAKRSGAHGCAHVCSNVSCVLSHVDAEFLPNLTVHGNTAIAD